MSANSENPWLDFLDATNDSPTGDLFPEPKVKRSSLPQSMSEDGGIPLPVKLPSSAHGLVSSRIKGFEDDDVQTSFPTEKRRESISKAIDSRNLGLEDIWSGYGRREGSFGSPAERSKRPTFGDPRQATGVASPTLHAADADAFLSYGTVDYTIRGREGVAPIGKLERTQFDDLDPYAIMGKAGINPQRRSSRTQSDVIGALDDGDHFQIGKIREGVVPKGTRERPPHNPNLTSFFSEKTLTRRYEAQMPKQKHSSHRGRIFKRHGDSDQKKSPIDCGHPQLLERLEKEGEKKEGGIYWDIYFAHKFCESRERERRKSDSFRQNVNHPLSNSSPDTDRPRRAMFRTLRRVSRQNSGLSKNSVAHLKGPHHPKSGKLSRVGSFLSSFSHSSSHSNSSSNSSRSETSKTETKMGHKLERCSSCSDSMKDACLRWRQGDEEHMPSKTSWKKILHEKKIGKHSSAGRKQRSLSRRGRSRHRSLPSIAQPYHSQSDLDLHHNSNEHVRGQIHRRESAQMHNNNSSSVEDHSPCRRYLGKEPCIDPKLVHQTKSRDSSQPPLTRRESLYDELSRHGLDHKVWGKSLFEHHEVKVDPNNVSEKGIGEDISENRRLSAALPRQGYSLHPQPRRQASNLIQSHLEKYEDSHSFRRGPTHAESSRQGHRNDRHGENGTLPHQKESHLEVGPSDAESTRREPYSMHSNNNQPYEKGLNQKRPYQESPLKEHEDDVNSRNGRGLEKSPFEKNLQAHLDKGHEHETHNRHERTRRKSPRSGKAYINSHDKAVQAYSDSEQHFPKQLHPEKKLRRHSDRGYLHDIRTDHQKSHERRVEPESTHDASPIKEQSNDGHFRQSPRRSFSSAHSGHRRERSEYEPFPPTYKHLCHSRQVSFENQPGYSPTEPFSHQGSFHIGALDKFQYIPKHQQSFPTSESGFVESPGTAQSKEKSKVRNHVAILQQSFQNPSDNKLSVSPAIPKRPSVPFTHQKTHEPHNVTFEHHIQPPSTKSNTFQNETAVKEVTNNSHASLDYPHLDKGPTGSKKGEKMGLERLDEKGKRGFPVSPSVGVPSRVQSLNDMNFKQRSSAQQATAKDDLERIARSDTIWGKDSFVKEKIRKFVDMGESSREREGLGLGRGESKKEHETKQANGTPTIQTSITANDNEELQGTNTTEDSKMKDWLEDKEKSSLAREINIKGNDSRKVIEKVFYSDGTPGSKITVIITVEGIGDLIVKADFEKIGANKK